MCPPPPPHQERDGSTCGYSPVAPCLCTLCTLPLQDWGPPWPPTMQPVVQQPHWDGPAAHSHHDPSSDASTVLSLNSWSPPLRTLFFLPASSAPMMLHPWRRFARCNENDGKKRNYNIFDFFDLMFINSFRKLSEFIRKYSLRYTTIKTGKIHPG